MIHAVRRRFPRLYGACVQRSTFNFQVAPRVVRLELSKSETHRRVKDRIGDGVLISL